MEFQLEKNKRTIHLAFVTFTFLVKKIVFPMPFTKPDSVMLTVLKDQDKMAE